MLDLAYPRKTFFLTTRAADPRPLRGRPTPPPRRARAEARRALCRVHRRAPRGRRRQHRLTRRQTRPYAKAPAPARAPQPPPQGPAARRSRHARRRPPATRLIAKSPARSLRPSFLIHRELKRGETTYGIAAATPLPIPNRRPSPSQFLYDARECRFGHEAREALRRTSVARRDLRPHRETGLGAHGYQLL
jgi:hypothetical protein